MTLESVNISYEDPQVIRGLFAKDNPPPNGAPEAPGGDNPPPNGAPEAPEGDNPPPNGKQQRD